MCVTPWWGWHHLLGECLAYSSFSHGFSLQNGFIWLDLGWFELHGVNTFARLEIFST
jgi:hypothetical protein